MRGCRVVYSGDYKRQPDPTCAAFTPVPCDLFITEATFGLPVFRHPDPRPRSPASCTRSPLFPERCHVIGAYALGKAQRVIALLRQAGWDRPIYLPRRPDPLVRPLPARTASTSASCARPPPARRAARAGAHGPDRPRPAGRHRRPLGPRLPDPVVCLASGWMRVKQRAKQRGVELPLVISDHADWDELLATMDEVGAPEVWITHGREEALAHAAGRAGSGPGRWRWSATRRRRHRQRVRCPGCQPSVAFACLSPTFPRCFRPPASANRARRIGSRLSACGSLAPALRRTTSPCRNIPDAVPRTVEKCPAVTAPAPRPQGPFG